MNASKFRDRIAEASSRQLSLEADRLVVGEDLKLNRQLLASIRKKEIFSHLFASLRWQIR